MRLFVLGATGAIGGHAIPALVAEGHTVSALARSPEKSAELTAHGATPVHASLFDSLALAQAFSGHDAVINLATEIPPGLAGRRPHPYRRLSRRYRRCDSSRCRPCRTGISQHAVSRPWFRMDRRGRPDGSVPDGTRQPGGGGECEPLLRRRRHRGRTAVRVVLRTWSTP